MNVNDHADNLLRQIDNMINSSLNSVTQIRSAIVKSVNKNGSVNIYIPPNDDKIFTNISNQSAFELHEGDSVELMVKDNNFSNCWVIAKHNTSNNLRQMIKDIVLETLQENNLL